MNTRHSYIARIPLFLALFTIALLHTLFISLSGLSASGISAAVDASPLPSASTLHEPPNIGKIQHASLLRGDSTLGPNAAPTEDFAITLRTTVGLNQHECASQPIISVAPGTEVVYCYFVTNTGTEALNIHTVENSQRGALLTNVSFPLAAGTSALVTTTVMVTETTVHVGTWNSTDGAGSILATATSPAKVYVNALTIEAGIGFPNDPCPQEDKLPVSLNTEITLCYRLVNNSDLQLSTHALLDSQSGELISALSYPLAPGESVTTQDLGITLADIVNDTTVYTFTWRASTITLPPDIPGERLDEAVTLTSVATATALVPELVTQLTVGLEPDTCAATKELTVFAGTEVVFCYYAHNTGNVTFTHHTVIDDFPLADSNAVSETRSIVNNTQYNMPPDGLGQFTNAQKAYTSTVVTMEWTAFSSNAVSTTTPIDSVAYRNLSTLQRPAPIASATATSQVTITVLPLAKISITVYEDSNQNGIKEANEQGIPNAAVTLTSDSNVEPITTTTNANGIATFSAVPPAIYDITISFDALQAFQPIGTSPSSALLRSGSNEGIMLGYQRIGNPPEYIYIPIQVSR